MPLVMFHDVKQLGQLVVAVVFVAGRLKSQTRRPVIQGNLPNQPVLSTTNQQRGGE